MKYAYILLLASLLVHCGRRNESSAPEHFSSFSSGYVLELQGEISLEKPTDAELEQIVLWDAKEEAIRHASDPAAAQALANLLDPTKKPESLQAAIKALKLDDPAFWIKRQLLYGIRIGNERIPLSLNETSLKIKRSEGNQDVYRYSAQAQISLSDKNAPQLSKMDLYFPRNPLTIFFETNSFSNLSDIEKTRDKTASFECFKPDGDPVSPHNYFYYLDPYGQPDCARQFKDKFFVINRPKVIPESSRLVYPEFHELFDDGRLDVIIAFTEIDKEKTAYRNWLSLQRELQYSQKFDLKQKDGPKDLILSKTIKMGNGDPLLVSIRLIYEVDNVDAVKEKFMEGGIAENEIIAYVGHAGYGEDLFDMFNSKTPYPKEKYQIFFLASCSSYSYAVNSILTSKSLMDLDPDNLFVDVLSTGQMSIGAYDFAVLNGLIGFFENAARHFGTKQIKEDSYQALLKIMDERDAPARKDKAEFTIAGEEHNVFDPSLVKNVRPEGRDKTKMLEFIGSFISDDTRDFEARYNLMRKAVRAFGVEIRPVVLGLLKDRNKDIRGEAVRYIAYRKLRQVDNQDAVNGLLDIVRSDTVTEVRLAAFSALTELGARSPAIATAFIDLAKNDRDEDVSETAYQSLGELGIANDETLTFFDEVLSKEPIESRKFQAAAMAISKLASTSSTGQQRIASILLQVAPKVASERYIVSQVIEGLGNTRINDPAIISLLENFLNLPAKDDYCGATALNAIAKIAPKNSPELVEFLASKLETMLGDKRSVTPLVNALIAIDGNTPRVKEILGKNLAAVKDSSDCYPRLPFGHALAKFDPGNQLALESLLAQAHDPKNSSCSGGAIEALADVGYKDPTFVEFLFNAVPTKDDYWASEHVLKALISLLGVQDAKVQNLLNQLFASQDPEKGRLKESAAIVLASGDPGNAVTQAAKDYLEKLAEEREDPGRDDEEDD